MAPEYGSRLAYREVYIDPAELLHLMNDDYIELVIYDVRDERDWNMFHLVDAERIALRGPAGTTETVTRPVRAGRGRGCQQRRNPVPRKPGNG